MKLDAHYVDPRLVALYDHDNPRGIDTDFYLALANEINAQRIIDLGCGTGTLTCELALQGHELIGVDPAAEMLAVARNKRGADKVTWVEGNASALEKYNVDLAIMSGNVAQVFVDDTEWSETLRELHGALRPGGYLAFESRNPLAKAWEQWEREDTYEQINTAHGSLTCWLEVVEVNNEWVRFVAHNVFEATGEDVIVESTLRFRDRETIATTLQDAGFTVENVFGDWRRAPFQESSRLMIFVAQSN